MRSSSVVPTHRISLGRARRRSRDQRRRLRGGRRAGGCGDGAVPGLGGASPRGVAVAPSRRERRGRPSSPPRSRSSKAPPRRRSSEEASGDPSAAARAGSGKGVGDAPRVFRNALRAFFAALGSPVASRVTKCGHAEVTALLFEETQTETAETALVDRASVSSFDAGAVAVAECAAAACASAGVAVAAVRGVAGVRELESEATQNATNASKINARATPRSGRSRLAMYCLGELARLPPSVGRASASGDAGVAASFETLARDAFETRSEKKSGKESHAQTHAKHGDESFVTPAALALGGACAGLECRARFLPFVVSGVADAADARAEYAFLVATREAIFSAPRDDIADGFLAAPRRTLVPTTLNRLKQSRRRRSSPAPRLRPSWRRFSPPPSARRRRGRAPSSRSASGDSPLAKRSVVDDDDAAENENAKEGLGLMARLRGDARDARGSDPVAARRRWRRRSTRCFTARREL